LEGDDDWLEGDVRLEGDDLVTLGWKVMTGMVMIAKVGRFDVSFQ
jgi:hypothetical protein